MTSRKGFYVSGNSLKMCLCLKEGIIKSARRYSSCVFHSFSFMTSYEVFLTSCQFNSRVFDASRCTWQNKSAPIRFLARVLYVRYGRVSSQTFPLVSFRQQSSCPVLNVDKRVSLKLWVISETKRAVYNREGLDLDWIRIVFII